MAVVAQLVRVPDCGSVGRRFESDLPPERKQQLLLFLFSAGRKQSSVLYLFISNSHNTNILYRYISVRETAEDLAHNAFHKAIEKADKKVVVKNWFARKIR